MTTEQLRVALTEARTENARLRTARGLPARRVKRAKASQAPIAYPGAYVSEPYQINATVTPGTSIALDGQRPNYDVSDEARQGFHKAMSFSVEYKIGDQAVYDGWNFNYFGKIVAIGPKTVTIVENHGDTKHRLTIERFCFWNNRDVRFDRDQRANWSD